MTITNSTTNHSFRTSHTDCRPLRSSRNVPKNIWAIILAGGEGVPRRSRISPHLGGQRPRHFCRTPDSDYLINHTRDIVASVFPRDRTIFTVSERHLRYSEDVLFDVPRKNLVVEPHDDGSAFAVTYSLLRIKAEDPSATVVFFPAELRVPEPKSLMARVQDAIEVVQREPRLLLLGIEPDSADGEREWIVPNLSTPIDEDLNVWPVLNFRNGVSDVEAKELTDSGGLWNSSVMVGSLSTFLRKMRRTNYKIYSAFEAVQAKIGTAAEGVAIRRIYNRNYKETDFSQAVLTKAATKLGVLPVVAYRVKGAGKAALSDSISIDAAAVVERQALAAAATT